jgi:hypothetical protein
MTRDQAGKHMQVQVKMQTLAYPSEREPMAVVKTVIMPRKDRGARGQIYAASMCPVPPSPRPCAGNSRRPAGSTN